jgi:hypothetical protein
MVKRFHAWVGLGFHHPYVRVRMLSVLCAKDSSASATPRS